jgi:DNA-binding response OmpR family regulator
VIQFLRPLRSAVARLRDGDAGAAKDIRDLAHWLAAAASTMDAARVETLARELETASLEEMPPISSKLIEELREATLSELPGEQVILIVDDEPEWPLLYRAALEQPGRRFIEAATIAAAEEALEREHVSLVILDVVLPDGDGRTFLQKIRAQYSSVDLPVIICAGLGSASTRVHAYALGADNFFAKPIDLDLLVAAVAYLLRRGGSRREDVPSQVAASPPDVPESATPSSRQQAVLLIEDDDVVASLIEHRLEREGLLVRRAHDAIEAREHLSSEKIDLCICEMNVPGSGGCELVSEIRRNASTARVPVILLSSVEDENEIARALRVGADDYVLKPFSPVALLARAKRLLSRDEILPRAS